MPQVTIELASIGKPPLQFPWIGYCTRSKIFPWLHNSSSW
jgi:hypothetical protein